jgi:glycosyltransferase involved in cell wall biosynthesis
MARPWPVLLMARELALGGSERQLAEMALALDRTVFEPHVACFRGGGFRAQELRSAGVPVVDLGVYSLISWPAVMGSARLRRYLARHHIALVHTFDVPSNFFGVPLARLFRVPVVLSSQRAHRALTPGLRRHLLRLTDRLAAGIVVNSRAVARELVTEDRVPESMLRLAHNGVDTSVFHPGVEAARLPWTGARAVVGVVCALRREKGVAVLLRAFARVLRLDPGIRLLIVGDGPDLARLRALAGALELGDACRFEPAAQHVAPWLRAMDIFVLPSLSEALSNSLLEALACGCCAVASSVGGNPELVEDGQTGFLFPPGDSAALAARLVSLIGDEGTRRRVAENAVLAVRERFSRPAAARRMGEIYLEFLERG